MVSFFTILWTYLIRQNIMNIFVTFLFWIYLQMHLLCWSDGQGGYITIVLSAVVNKKMTRLVKISISVVWISF